MDEDFVDLSHISDREFTETMNAVSQTVKSCKPGDDINPVIGNDDTVVEFEVARERADCYSIIGLAREAAAAFNKPMKHHEPVIKSNDLGSIYELLDVDVFADEQVNRYTSRMVTNVKIAPSPKWLCRRLQACGIRPVNNIVDIANYVMLEYGQPVNVFDYRYVPDGYIMLREAQDGETLTTQDGHLYSLKNGMLVSADEYHPIGLAGIMGGEHSEVKDDTVTVVFEAANFKSDFIHKTALALDIKTDASIRHEKCLDPMMTLTAAQRACELVEQLECGEVLDGIIDIINYVPNPRTIELDPDQINRMLGADMTDRDMIAYLNRLEIPVEGQTILIPSFRPDINGITDIANEVARLHRNR